MRHDPGTYYLLIILKFILRLSRHRLTEHFTPVVITPTLYSESAELNFQPQCRLALCS
jgi:hypothetical protein